MGKNRREKRRGEPGSFFSNAPLRLLPRPLREKPFLVSKCRIKPWTKILLVVNVGSLEKRSNQPKYKEPRTRSPKTTAKLIQNNVYCFLNITIFRLAIPAFFRLTDVTELM